MYMHRGVLGRVKGYWGTEAPLPQIHCTDRHRRDELALAALHEFGLPDGVFLPTHMTEVSFPGGACVAGPLRQALIFFTFGVLSVVFACTFPPFGRPSSSLFSSCSSCIRGTVGAPLPASACSAVIDKTLRGDAATNKTTDIYVHIDT